MSGITIVGLGPGQADQLTLEAQAVLSAATEIWLRTRQHPVVPALPAHLTMGSFDEFYDRGDSFASVYAAIADRVMELGRRPAGVVYAVPGHPLVGEATVSMVIARAREEGLALRVVAGVSFVEAVCTALGLDPLHQGLQILDATTVVPSDPFSPAAPPDVTRPLLLAQLYGERVASRAKLALLEHYPADHGVSLVRAAGVDGQEMVTSMPLYRMDRRMDQARDLDALTCLYVPPLPPGQDLATLSGFQRIVARLRAPDGCPWDREQTHASLKRHLLEEAYEVLGALDAEDPDKVCEELGDLLLQIVLHAQIAVEDEEFTLDDVVRGISEKLVRRHPHVFATAQVTNTGELLRTWERIKQDERDRNHDEGDELSLLAGVPVALPGLAASRSIQDRVSRVGFDWSSLDGVLEQLTSELGELHQAKDQAQRLHEFGDMLFAVVNAGRWLGVDAEEALRTANARFRRRFAAMERLCRERGQAFADLTLDEKNRLWAEVKQRSTGPDDIGEV
jgi:tetrapyrrole methylase family protein/MazG family protein